MLVERAKGFEYCWGNVVMVCVGRLSSSWS